MLESKKKTISTNLDPKTIEKLKALARERTISVAAVIRQAVLRFLEESEE